MALNLYVWNAEIQMLRTYSEISVFHSKQVYSAQGKKIIISQTGDEMKVENWASLCWKTTGQRTEEQATRSANQRRATVPRYHAAHAHPSEEKKLSSVALLPPSLTQRSAAPAHAMAPTPYLGPPIAPSYATRISPHACWSTVLPTRGFNARNR